VCPGAADGRARTAPRAGGRCAAAMRTRGRRPTREPCAPAASPDRRSHAKPHRAADREPESSPPTRPPNSTTGDGREAAPLDRGRMVPVASAVEVTADSRHVHRDRRRRRAARSGCAGACGIGAGDSSTSGCDSVVRWPGGKCFGGLSPEARGHTVAAPATTHMRSRLWPCPRPAPTASVRQSPRGSQPEPFAARPCHRRGWTHHAMS
jgi:hypothetical protein